MENNNSGIESAKLTADILKHLMNLSISLVLVLSYFSDKLVPLLKSGTRMPVIIFCLMMTFASSLLGLLASNFFYINKKEMALAASIFLIAASLCILVGSGYLLSSLVNLP